MQWRAHYSDGTTLESKEGEDRYSQIDRTKLQAFEIYNDKRTLAVLHLEPGQRLIFRKIGVKYFNTATKEESNGPKTILCGWQQTIHGKNIQSILYITPDGIVHQAGRFLHGAPNLRPDEV